jgi:hypothetical protein
MTLTVVERFMVDELATGALAAAVLITGFTYLFRLAKAERARRNALTQTKRYDEDFENNLW